MKILADGRKRQLVFKSIQLADAGNYHCKTNADETTCELIVNCKYFIYNFYFNY